MPIDRAAVLKNAEKLLRQGKLQPAIAEYVRVVEEQPRDFNTANALGDLYVRAKQIDKAVEQFIRIADCLNEDGFLPKAAALYKKVIKIKPDHEHALLQAAEIAASQNLYADARAYLGAVADKRAAAGDKRGHAQIRIRIGNLDPADYPSRVSAARARVEINDAAGAVRDLKEIAAELNGKSRQAEALEALRDAATIAPDDEEIRGRLFDVYMSSGDLGRAIECATTAAQFKALSAAFEARQSSDDALQMLREAARLDPGDAELRVHLAKIFVARGDMATAGHYLTVETAGDDPQLLTVVAEMRLRAGQVDEGLAIAQRLLDSGKATRDQIALIGWNVAEQQPEAGYRVVQLAAESSVRQGDWAAAAAALQEFVTRVPSHLPALMRLVEICVDGGLEATLYSAQAHLADAYITAGMAAEARFIAEDLVAREPWERANIERFRKALEMMDEPDPDSIIAERLSGQSPFMSTDATLDFPPFEEPPAPAAVAAAPEPPASRRPSSEPAEDDAIDLGSLLGAKEAPPPAKPKAYAKTESVEVDLSIVLDDLNAPSPPAAIKARDIDGVFEQLRDEASRRSIIEAAEKEYKRGLALHKAGDIEGALAALQAASRAPKLRFMTASLVGRMYKQRGNAAQAVEWLERAAQAPAPSPTDYHQLLYEIADLLEHGGEIARALAICLELQADAGSYRDVADRIDRLAKVQARE